MHTNPLYWCRLYAWICLLVCDLILFYQRNWNNMKHLLKWLYTTACFLQLKIPTWVYQTPIYLSLFFFAFSSEAQIICNTEYAWFARTTLWFLSEIIVPWYIYTDIRIACIECNTINSYAIRANDHQHFFAEFKNIQLKWGFLECVNNFILFYKIL